MLSEPRSHCRTRNASKKWPEIEERRRKKLAQIYPSHSEGDDEPPGYMRMSADVETLPTLADCRRPPGNYATI